ncbi:HAD family hydrolase [Mucilaginibacter sp.]|uniref:D-glycero-alpha-D-manno-heptose-1,7-bisphosphate 7-phosphatase n=1 Tax=Mucilaginibacter sp. TaxID=1882438 RepID=UPI00262C44D7|nr:HAD family hydrolase [Mucilaginibacter sp.]MDB4926648.1 hydrolase, HAD-superfamily, subfamily [Mucilaginibacter sp.]
MTKKKAVFLDKDGTLITDVPYNADPAFMALSSHCVAGLHHLQEKGYLLVVVSNQAGVARGYFSETALIAVEQRLKEMLAGTGIILNGFYYCPHHPDGMVKSLTINCDCRKPAPGLLFKAAEELDIDLSTSWMIGDILNDIEAGNRAGCRSILIDNGNETEWYLNEIRNPVLKARTINEAADHILKTDVK